jgi:hypothetical protein
MGLEGVANSGRPRPRTFVVWRLEGEEERVSGAELVREDVADSGSVGLVGDIFIFGGVVLIVVVIVCICYGQSGMCGCCCCY